MKKFFLSLFVIAFIFAAIPAHAKVWRLNNNAGVAADFTTFNAAIASASVLAGDTLYLEPSTTTYQTGSITLTKRIVVVGPGYFLDPADVTFPANTGLQVATSESSLAFLRIGAGADGSKFLGVSFPGSIYFNAANHITFEKVFINSGMYFESGINDSISFRKCFFYSGNVMSDAAAATITNLVVENSIFYAGYYLTLNTPTGSGNILRNNSMVGSYAFTLQNTYVANNIFNVGSQCTFTNCTIKNNLFQIAQTLPGTAVGNQLNVNMTNVFVGGTTGSLDSRAALKAGSPAIAAGLTIGAVVTPDCGAYGATDPYKLSGIPNIPSIYALTVPVSIPSGSTTMNVTFSTRNTN